MATTLDPSILTAALEGLEQQYHKIDEQIREVRSMLGQRGPGRPPKHAAAPQANAPARKRRSMSASAKRRIAAAQKKRWAEYHKKQRAGA